jgi:RNA polymerase sigma-70 factor (ECF subfamily)
VGDHGEAELVAKLRDGDAAAFDEAYRAFRDRIYNFLYRLSGRRDLAEDLFQETWIKLARHARSLREDTNLSAWLFTVARNQYRSHQRWSVVDRARVSELGAEPRADSPETAALAHDELLRLSRALDGLSTDHREVLLLSVIEEIEAREVAAILSISPEAVRQRLSRARASLAAALEQQLRVQRREGA